MFNQLISLIFLLSITLNAALADSLNLGTTTLNGSFSQGGMVFGKTDPQNKVFLNNKDVRITPNGDFVFGFGRDAKDKSKLTIRQPNGQVLEKFFSVKKRDYNIQRVEGVPKRTVYPSKESLVRIKKETAQVKQARTTDSNLQHFLQTFQWPLIGNLTGFYGSQRFYNGEPGRPHYGIDIAAPTGTLVYAPVDATITLAHKDMFYSGGTLIMDHGYGISSTFIHLSELLVKVGDKVKQGDPVAKVGAGGRATGPHLDWRINWFKVRLDPQLLVPPMPK